MKDLTAKTQRQQSAVSYQLWMKDANIKDSNHKDSYQLSAKNNGQRSAFGF
jgi:hypothetical protein